MDLKQIRANEIERRKRGEKTNINTPEMQDLRWRSYGKTRKQLMPAMIEMYDYICSKVGFGSFLDVGCGEGEIIWSLMGKFELLVGVDISPVRIWWNIQKAIEMEASDCVLFLYSDAENLVFEDNSFDNVTCTATIEHVTNTAKAISEIMRVLKPRGKAFFGIPIEPAQNQPIKSPDHYNFYTDEKSILKLFDGLNIVSTKFIKPNLIVEINK
jgi:ubiquinone/menaquinone biosynthesis C-methylase UbiE